MKPKTINNRPTIITNVNNSPVLIKNKLQKNHKKNWLLISVYLLMFGITGVTTTTVLLHNHANYSDSNFNPHSNSNLWEQYYKNNKPDNKLIDLTPTKRFFKDNANSVVWKIHSVKDKNSLSFSSVLNQIDNKLQDGGIETVSQQTVKSLPTDFFTNIINNPAVDFTINSHQVTNSTFKWPDNYNQSTSCDLKVSTSDEANAFGIQNNNINFVIKVTITNLLTVDLKDVKLDNLSSDQTIYTDYDSSTNATIPQIIKYIQPTIKDAFITKLKAILQIDKIPDNDYEITFNGNDDKTKYDFNKDSVPVNFQITSTEDSKNYNFTGKLESSINVKNEVFNISNETELQTEIQNKYSIKEKNRDNWLNIVFDNKTDKDNVDTCLTDKGLTVANDEINKVIKPFVVSYFNDKHKALNLKPNDIKITSDLQLKDNLFQNNDGILGKQCTISISAKQEGYKLSGKLPINITIHGKNIDATTQNHNSPDSFKLNGIYLPDGQDADILQDNEHYYQQTTLLANWMGDDKDSLKSKFNNAYSINKDSFSGSFTSKYQLETSGAIKDTTFKISDIKNKKITNFYDLINQTKNIYLHTSVTKNSSSEKKDRTLNSVELVFTSTIDPPYTNGNNILYSFKIVTEEKTSIDNGAKLMFSNFNFKIAYQQNN
ncbi:hypothetical protein [Spiroplasma endosymbiont of Virgichneumon dumeticola]|uniref:hypothetical protein n=1 Tax=Spiroplasma endosymbiont of Virgichneumon dumeticola TaxID=3139323 RepID=UPI0035C8E371